MGCWMEAALYRPAGQTGCEGTVSREAFGAGEGRAGARGRGGGTGARAADAFAGLLEARRRDLATAGGAAHRFEGLALDLGTVADEHQVAAGRQEAAGGLAGGPARGDAGHLQVVADHQASEK